MEMIKYDMEKDKLQKVDREYIVKGNGRTYTIWAKSSASAKYKAAVLYKEETGDEFPADLFKEYFEPMLVERKHFGPKPGYLREVD